MRARDAVLAVVLILGAWAAIAFLIIGGLLVAGQL
jgi:hypothetical protein